MTSHTQKKSKHSTLAIIAFAVIILLVVMGSMANESKGQITSQDWQAISPPMTKEEVIEAVGRPKNRTTDANKIKESYYESLDLQAEDGNLNTDSASQTGQINVVGLLELEAALDQGQDVEMFHYQIDGEDYFVCFLNDQFLVKY